MKKVFITYGDEKYKKSLELLESTAMENGVDEFIAYDRDYIVNSKMYNNSARTKYILDKPRGSGYWIWKPYIISETFKSLEYGDIVIYSDAGLKVIDNLQPLYNIASKSPNKPILFKLPPVGVDYHKAKTWTKKDCFVLTNSDESKYWDADMSNGAVSVWVKSKHNEDLLLEWFKYLKDPRISTDDPNMCGPNYQGFRDHRHDQSVLSILRVKYDIPLYRDPTQYGNTFMESNSLYKQLFHHHRNFKH